MGAERGGGHRSGSHASGQSGQGGQVAGLPSQPVGLYPRQVPSHSHPLVPFDSRVQQPRSPPSASFSQGQPPTGGSVDVSVHSMGLVVSFEPDVSVTGGESHEWNIRLVSAKKLTGSTIRLTRWV